MAESNGVRSAEDKLDPPYRDASSSALGPEEDKYTDAASAAVAHPQVDGDGATSGSADGSFHDALEDQHGQGSADEMGDLPSTVSPSEQQNEGAASIGQGEDNKHVYFILEKQDDLEESGDEMAKSSSGGKYKGQTLARAKVNVAARAKMFEETGSNPFGSGAQDAARQNSSVSDDPVYDVPPALKAAGDTGVHGDSWKYKDDKDIYEINFDDDQGQKPGSLQNSGSFGSSGNYEEIQQALEQKLKPSLYELAKPISVVTESDIVGRTSELSSSGGYLPCMQGAARVGQGPSVVPSKEEIETEYHRLQFNRKSARSTPQEAGYHSLDRFAGPLLDPTTNEPIYETTPDSRSRTLDSDRLSVDRLSDGSWGSSEFEEYSDDEDGYEAEPDTPAPTKPLPRVPKAGDSLQRGGLLHKLKHANTKSPTEEVSTVCLPVVLNISKHPPPELPPPPDGLSESQRKCRCVIELTISSERSYIESLERIVQEYEKPILEVISQPKFHIRAVFKEAREILNHHKMFQIELAETVKKWDEEERIGDIFTASFSKSMLVDAYSVYVNNFAAAMDEIRTVQQSRPSFEEFLKMKEKTSHDRLSIFGLMVKPVQRFPQFIMVIQDLIKYTPHSHHDRRALQLALTELENVAHKLNERKRLSEQYFQAKQTLQLLPRQLLTQGSSAPRRLIRFDNFEQIDADADQMKSTPRRLILMNDFLVCVKVGFKDQDGYVMERYRLKWAVKLSDIELKDTAMTPDMRGVVKMDPNRLRALTAQLEKNEEDPFHLYSELRDMLHDLSVLGQVSTLMKSLKRNYQGHGLSEELLKDVVSDLQRMIQIKDEQLHLVNSCSIILVDTSKPDKPHYILQTPTASVKNEWCVDFSMAKLALEKQNRPGWDRSPLAGDEESEPVPAFFMKCVPVDVPRHFTKIKCATPVFVPSSMGASGVGMKHLWVCSSTSSRGQVSVVSLQHTRPALTEMFKACDCDLLCCEVVPGCGSSTHTSRFVFSEDTVWMANVHNEIIIFPVASSGGMTATRDPLAVLRVTGKVTTIRFVDERLFCGLDDGAVLVYSRNDAGEWCVKSARTLMLGRAPVRCQLVMDEHLWVACGHSLHVVEIDSVKSIAVHKLAADHENHILQMVRCGVGVWVAFHNSSVLRLFHSETMENLQEMSVANTVNRVLSEKTASSESRDCVVTCLAASTGLLWIGTSLGLVLTLPLPRLSDGVPLYRGRPSVSYHAHRGPVRFIIAVYCSGSVMELHRNSSLRCSLRARPSIRNRKREVLETDGAAKEEKLLSSGAADLDASLQATETRHKGKQAAGYMEVLPPRPHELPTEKRDHKFAQHLKAFKNGRMTSISSTLGGYGKRGNAAKRIRGQTLSFRSELANRIKQTSQTPLSKHQTHVQSMFDLRSDDVFEVEMFYENLLDTGELSEDDHMDVLDDLSIRSDTSLVVGGKSPFGSQTLGSGKIVESLDLAGIHEEDQGKASKSSASSSATDVCNETQARSSSDVVPESTTKAAESAPAGESSAPSTPPPSPRISLIRANTMRKTSTSNAVMVLSGGDGYVDINTGNITSRNEDASLLLWIYKF